LINGAVTPRNTSVEIWFSCFSCAFLRNFSKSCSISYADCGASVFMSSMPLRRDCFVSNSWVGAQYLLMSRVKIGCSTSVLAMTWRALSSKKFGKNSSYSSGRPSVYSTDAASNTLLKSTLQSYTSPGAASMICEHRWMNLSTSSCEWSVTKRTISKSRMRSAVVGWLNYSLACCAS
jgi:hypothetical protein